MAGGAHCAEPILRAMPACHGVAKRRRVRIGTDVYGCLRSGHLVQCVPCALEFQKHMAVWTVGWRSALRRAQGERRNRSYRTYKSYSFCREPCAGEFSAAHCSLYAMGVFPSVPLRTYPYSSVPVFASLRRGKPALPAVCALCKVHCQPENLMHRHFSAAYFGPGFFADGKPKVADGIGNPVVMAMGVGKKIRTFQL